jgi:hypothetical protein
MAITKTVLKQNHIEALVKVVNDANESATTTFELAVDLLKSNEELSGADPTVNIGSVECSVSVGAEANVTRDSVVILNLFENTDRFELPFGADSQNNTSDIVVNFTGKGTVYIRLLKLAGYRPLFRPEQGVNLI